MDRRYFFQGSALLGSSAVLGCATANAREMGSDPAREPPSSFQKPADAVQYVAAGTPENVGPVVVGDVIEMHIDRLPGLSVKIV